MKKQLLILVVMLVGFSQVGWSQYKLYEDGLAKYKAGKFQECIALLTDFLSRPYHDKKLDVDAYYYRALSYYKRDVFDKAISDFEETILLDRDNKGNIYWFMAKANDYLAAYNEALNNYTNAIKEIGDQPENKAKLYYERSQIYAKTGNVSAQLEDLNSGSIANPQNKEIRASLDKLNAQTASTRSPASKDVPVVKGPEKGTDKKTTPEKKIEKQPVKEPAVAQNKPADKTVTAPVVTQPVVQQPVVVVPAAPTLAELYKDERRYALVIGNSKYSKEIGILKNPVNDATDIAKELRACGFDVTLLTDATYGQMRANMLKFKEKVDGGDRDKTVALFFYAGHGLQHDDENFLVPVDASIEFEDDIARYCFPIQRMVLANMERSNSRMNIVILDACRNNPFPALTRSVGQQGLGEMKRARGSFIAYATAPGSVASDGDGRNGLYTQELLRALKKPQITIEQVFKEVRQNVLRQSGDKQNTWDSSNIVGDFYFKLQ